MCSTRILWGFVLIFSACGYRPVTGRLPDGSGSVHIPLVENRTAFPCVASALTEALRTKTRQSGLRVTPGAAKAYRLRVRIVNVGSTPGMLRVANGHLDPLEQVWLIRAEATLEDPSGRAVRGPKAFEAGGRSLASGNPSADEALGHRRRLALQEDLAELIVDFMFQ